MTAFESDENVRKLDHTNAVTNNLDGSRLPFTTASMRQLHGHRHDAAERSGLLPVVFIDPADERYPITRSQINQIGRDAASGTWGDTAAAAYRQAYRNGQAARERGGGADAIESELEQFQDQINGVLASKRPRTPYRCLQVSARNPDTGRNERLLLLKGPKDDPDKIISDYFAGFNGGRVIPLVAPRKSNK